MKNTVNLIGYGIANGKPAKDFKIGEKMLWNYGGTGTILKIVKETNSFITFLEQDDTYPNVVLERKLKKDRIVGAASLNK